MAENATRTTREIVWQPQPRQELAVRCPSFELFFGGAAGGGKTDFLLADYLDVWIMENLTKEYCLEEKNLSLMK